jgi:hypothetical protein
LRFAYFGAVLQEASGAIAVAKTITESVADVKSFIARDGV